MCIDFVGACLSYSLWSQEPVHVGGGGRNYSRAGETVARSTWRTRCSGDPDFSVPPFNPSPTLLLRRCHSSPSARSVTNRRGFRLSHQILRSQLGTDRSTALVSRVPRPRERPPACPAWGHGGFGHGGFDHGRFEGRRFGRGLYAYGGDYEYGYCNPYYYPYGCYGY